MKNSNTYFWQVLQTISCQPLLHDLFGHVRRLESKIELYILVQQKWKFPFMNIYIFFQLIPNNYIVFITIDALFRSFFIHHLFVAWRLLFLYPIVVFVIEIKMLFFSNFMKFLLKIIIIGLFIEVEASCITQHFLKLMGKSLCKERNRVSKLVFHDFLIFLFFSLSFHTLPWQRTS